MTDEQEKALWGRVRDALLMIVRELEKVFGIERKCRRCGAGQ